ncbi:MAG: rhaM [Frankiales bacterium]|nr:rhaM [Frankiales bacterium]
MTRVCFRLQVEPAQLGEYRRRHAEVWPEMRAALTAAGWRNYSLFLAADGQLIGYLECDDFDAAQAAMAATDVNARWQREMSGFFVDLGAGRPDEGIVPLPEVFHLD